MMNHKWTKDEEKILIKVIAECEPLYLHYMSQGNYTKANFWDAVSGHLYPDVIVTGSACRNRYQVIQERGAREQTVTGGWKKTSDVVEKYERELSETTFDGVSELLGNADALFVELKVIKGMLADIKALWE